MVKKFYKCSVCGDIHFGVEYPEKCPTCGAKDAYESVDEEEAKDDMGF